MVPALHSPQLISDVPLRPDWAKLGWGINATGKRGWSLHGETEARSSCGPTPPAQVDLRVPLALSPTPREDTGGRGGSCVIVPGLSPPAYPPGHKLAKPD